MTFHIFVKPAIHGLSGKPLPDDPQDILAYHRTLNVELNTDKDFYPLDERPEFARAIITYGQNIPIARITGNQRSSRLMSARDANALVLLPMKSEDKKQIKNMDIIRAILL